MRIILTFSGWCELTEDTKMQRFTENESLPASITAAEWAKMPNADKDEYILDNAAQAIKDSTDGEYTELEIEEDTE